VTSTSGSTGQPKVVAVPHCAIVRLVRNAGYATLDADQVILHLAPLAFDASTFEIWGALANGARLVLYPHPLPDPELLRPLIRDQRVTTMWLTAGVFHQLVDDAIDTLRPLSQLIAGGDVLSPPHVATALRELPGCTLINGYGPTESTTFACCHRIVAQDEHASVPIGSPIRNTTAYVLDPQLALAGVGVAGELYLGGDGLARGYLHRPALTAERFLPDPFGPPGSRLYRTGDLARLSADGHLELLGRQDHQIKIRGHRIELGEVDAALRRQPGVRDALVVVRGEAAHDKRLVGYVVPPAAAAGLRATLAGQLPGFLIPSEIIGLDSFPLTPNGKIDRPALPTHDARLASSPAPASELEQALAEIWCDVFGVPAVGRHDNFFDLGGHSLIAMRIVSAYERVWGKTLSVHALLQHATIAELADFVGSST
jgi:acyl-coenzyme A synthetase/AMP-(fatty) acid ligase/acyl carrier protein